MLSSLLQKCLEGLVKTLRDLVNSPYAPEYDIAGITDPFLHIRLLKLLRVLGQGDEDASDCMNDILAQVNWISMFYFFLLYSVWNLDINCVLFIILVLHNHGVHLFESDDLSVSLLLQEDFTIPSYCYLSSTQIFNPIH